MLCTTTLLMAANVQSNGCDRDTFQLLLTLSQQWPHSAFFFSLHSMTLFLTLFHTSQIFFSATCFPFTVATGFPHCFYINFVLIKKQESQSGLQVIWRGGTDTSGDQTQGPVSSHMFCGKYKSLSFMEGPSFPLRNLQQKLLSEEKREKYFVFHTGTKLAGNYLGWANQNIKRNYIEHTQSFHVKNIAEWLQS